MRIISHHVHGLLDLICYTSMNLGLIGFSITYLAFIFLGQVPDIKLCLAVLLMSMAVYGVNRLTDKSEDSVNLPQRYNFVETHRQALIILAVLSLSTSIILAASSHLAAVPIILVPLILGAIYSHKFPGIPRLKDVLGVKNLVIGLSAASMVFLPLVSGNTCENLPLVLSIFWLIFIKLVVNTIIFDTRDVRGDSEAGILTIPVVLGPAMTTYLLIGLNLLLLPSVLFISETIRYLATALIVYGFVYIIYFSIPRPAFHYDWIIDAEWIYALTVYFIWRSNICW